MEQFADSKCGAGFLPSPLLCGAQGDVKPSIRTAWVLRRDFPLRGVPLRPPMKLSLAGYQCDLGTSEVQPSTAGPDALSAVSASESQHGCQVIEITSCPRLAAKLQETLMARI